MVTFEAIFKKHNFQLSGHKLCLTRSMILQFKREYQGPKGCFKKNSRSKAHKSFSKTE
jgi:hypothetical protein